MGGQTAKTATKRQRSTESSDCAHLKINEYGGETGLQCLLPLNAHRFSRAFKWWRDGGSAARIHTYAGWEERGGLKQKDKDRRRVPTAPISKSMFRREGGRDGRSRASFAGPARGRPAVRARPSGRWHPRCRSPRAPLGVPSIYLIYLILILSILSVYLILSGEEKNAGVLSYSLETTRRRQLSLLSLSLSPSAWASSSRARGSRPGSKWHCRKTSWWVRSRSVCSS